MPAILTFALAAPLGAMGALAVGERRSGWDRPGRSAVLGLIAACIGLERTAEGDHAALSAGLGLAIRREGPATALLSDYHTAQVPRTMRNRVFATRREELAVPEVETVLSRRDYRADIAFMAALWRRPKAPMRWTLADIAAAMGEPHFVPYLGRKSCPLGLPMAPLVAEAATIRDALIQRDAVAGALERRLVPRGAGGMVWADDCGPDQPTLGLDTTYRENRRDEPVSRARWQFGLREEIVAVWPQDAG